MADVIESVGTDARDHVDIGTWESSHSAGAGDVAIADCYNDSVFDEIVTINDTASDSYIIRAATGEAHDGTAGTGVRNVLSAGNDYCFKVSTAKNVTFEFIEADANGSTRGGITILTDPTSGAHIVSNCIIWGSGGSVRYPLEIKVTATIMNSVVYRDNTTSYIIRNLGNFAQTFLNTTIYGGQYGLGSPYGGATVVVTNTIAMAGTSYDFGGNLDTPSYNMSADATASGTGSLINKTDTDNLVSVTGSYDLHIKSGSDAIDQGTDLGTSPSGVEIDIDGYDRGGAATWDMGAHEFIATGSAIIHNILAYMRTNK